MIQDTEIRILEAAERLFLKQGFKATTTSQIAKEAGCNQALVHYYYRTKEKLFESIWIGKVKLLVASFSDLHLSYNSIEELVTEIINEHWTFLVKNSDLMLFILREMLNGTKFEYEQIMEEVWLSLGSTLSSIDTILNKEIQMGKINPISSKDLLFTIFSLDVFPFILPSLLKDKIKNSDTRCMLDEIKNRKEEVIKTVLARLRK
jgi:transcriptional regulator